MLNRLIVVVLLLYPMWSADLLTQGWSLSSAEEQPHHMLDADDGGVAKQAQGAARSGCMVVNYTKNRSLFLDLRLTQKARRKLTSARRLSTLRGLFRESIPWPTRSPQRKPRARP